jgi:hypothetical protein
VAEVVSLSGILKTLGKIPAFCFFFVAFTLTEAFGFAFALVGGFGFTFGFTFGFGFALVGALAVAVSFFTTHAGFPFFVMACDRNASWSPWLLC